MAEWTSLGGSTLPLSTSSGMSQRSLSSISPTNLTTMFAGIWLWVSRLEPLNKAIILHGCGALLFCSMRISLTKNRLQERLLGNRISRNHTLRRNISHCWTALSSTTKSHAFICRQESRSFRVHSKEDRCSSRSGNRQARLYNPGKYSGLSQILSLGLT